MLRVGVHVSIAGGLDRAVDRALKSGCDIFQIFSRNPRGWQSRDLAPEEVVRFIEKLEQSGLSLAVDHMPYLPNLASPREDVYSKSVKTLAAELDRCQHLHIPYLVTHMGSHLGAGWDEGFRQIVNAIEAAFSQPKSEVILLLENTSGTRNSMGGTFQEIAAIIEALSGKHSARLGVCLDTCHLFAAGYEVRTRGGLRETLKQFDASIGLERLKLVHLNDSRGDLGSGLDRHEHIGLGKIGEAGFRNILSHESIASLPLILETPVDERRDDKGNLQMVRRLASQLN